MTLQTYQNRLQDIISGKNDKKKKSSQAIIYVVFILGMYGLTFLMEKSKIFAMGIAIAIIIAAILINLFSSNKGKRKTYLLRAKQYLIQNQLDLALKNMLIAYDIASNDNLLNLMSDFIEDFNVSPENKAKVIQLIVEKEMPKSKKDKDYLKILEKLKQTADYLTKHQHTIDESRTKIKELNEKIRNLKDQKMLNEFQKLVERYENIIMLELAKINFYNKAQDELIKLRNKHLLNKELIKEKENLMKLEDKLLEKSLSESYSGSIDGFIIYEREFLKALDEYSETLSVSTDQNIFDEVMKEFQNKVKNI